MAVTCVACLRLLDVRRPPGYRTPPVTSQHMEFILLLYAVYPQYIDELEKSHRLSLGRD